MASYQKRKEVPGSHQVVPKKPTVKPEKEAADLKRKLAFLESEHNNMEKINANLKQTLLINKQMLNQVLMGQLTTDEEIITQLQEESDCQMAEMERLAVERSDLNGKVLLLEQIHFELSKKQIEMTESHEEEFAKLQDRLNKQVYLTDMKEKYLSEMTQIALKFAKKSQFSGKASKDIQKIKDIMLSKANMEDNLAGKGKHELQMKSVLFERDNLQMELEDALNQIDKLEQHIGNGVGIVGPTDNTDMMLHTAMDIQKNPYEDLEAAGGFHKDVSVEVNLNAFVNNQPSLKKKKDNFNESSNKDTSQGLGGTGPQQRSVPPIPSFGGAPKPMQKFGGLTRNKLQIAKLGVPALDFSNLKQVKEYKDWYGYSQKLENAIRLLREKIESLENERDLNQLHRMKFEQQIERLTAQNTKLEKRNTELSTKYQDMLEKNYKSARNANQDLEPMFKHAHSKTMTLVGMLKQYSTGGPGASQEPTARRDGANPLVNRLSGVGLTNVGLAPINIDEFQNEDSSSFADKIDGMLDGNDVLDVRAFDSQANVKQISVSTPAEEALETLKTTNGPSNDAEKQLEPQPKTFSQVQGYVKRKVLSLEVDKINEDHDQREQQRQTKKQKPSSMRM